MLTVNPCPAFIFHTATPWKTVRSSSELLQQVHLLLPTPVVSEDHLCHRFMKHDLDAFRGCGGGQPDTAEKGFQGGCTAGGGARMDTAVQEQSAASRFWVMQVYVKGCFCSGAPHVPRYTPAGGISGTFGYPVLTLRDVQDVHGESGSRQSARSRASLASNTVQSGHGQIDRLHAAMHLGARQPQGLYMDSGCSPQRSVPLARFGSVSRNTAAWQVRDHGIRAADIHEESKCC